MTLFQLILALIYVCLTIRVIDIFVNKKDKVLPWFDFILIPVWLLSIPAIITFIINYMIDNFHTPIDATFPTLAGIIIIAWLIIKNKKK